MHTQTPARHTSHSKGPWQIGGTYGETRVYDTSQTLIAELQTWRGSREDRAESDANASLIAAAPELLASLQDAVAAFDFTVSAMAKGQTVSISSLQNCAAAARSAIAKAAS